MMYYIILILFMMYTTLYISDGIISLVPRPSHCPIFDCLQYESNLDSDAGKALSPGSSLLFFHRGGTL